MTGTEINLSNSLADLAARINVANEAMLASFASSVEHAMEVGALLADARPKIPHGKWAGWLKDNCPGLSMRTAQRCQRLARNRAAIMAKYDTVSYLGINGALALLTTPRGSIDMTLVDGAVESLSITEDVEEALKSLEAIKQRKPLLDEADASLAKVEALLRDKPSLGAIVEDVAVRFSDEIGNASASYIDAVVSDLYDEARALAERMKTSHRRNVA